MGKTKQKKRKLFKKLDSPIATPKVEKKLKKKKKKLTTSKSKSKLKSKSKSKLKSKFVNPSSPSSSSDSEFGPEPENVEQLLDPYSKDQLIDLIVDAALSNSALFAKIQETADKDICHRKIFVHGLSWDTTNEDVVSEFKKFGEMESCNVVLDRVTGKSKGYAFITFTTRKSALKALKQPRKELKNRVVVCQLASLGPPSMTQGGGQQDGNLSGRKIYVTNVTSDVNAEKLRTFFAKFGEIESGPMGFDANTGKFKGYALFVYKSVEGAKKALEEPFKVFEGRQLQCQKAAEGKKIGGGAAGITTSMQPVPPVLAAMTPQNIPMVGQNPNLGVNPGLLSLNPFYGGFIGNPNAAAGFLNVSPFGGLGQVSGAGMGMGMGLGGYGRIVGSHSLGSFGSGITASGLSGGTVPSGTMQQAYPSTSTGQKSSSAQAPGTGGQSSYLWYDQF